MSERTREPVCKRSIKGTNKGYTSRALSWALGKYFMRTRDFNESTSMVYHFHKPFAYFEGGWWVLFDFVPECIINQAAIRLHRQRGMAITIAQDLILEEACEALSSARLRMQQSA